MVITTANMSADTLMLRLALQMTLSMHICSKHECTQARPDATYRVQVPGQICCCQNKDMSIRLGEAIHLDQELCLHTAGGLVLPFTPSHSHEGIHLIQKDSGGCMVPCQLKQDLTTQRLSTRALLELVTQRQDCICHLRHPRRCLQCFATAAAAFSRNSCISVGYNSLCKHAQPDWCMHFTVKGLEV